MRYFYISTLLLFSTIFQGSQLVAQDSIRITIADITISGIENEGEIVEVPVYMEYPHVFSGFQIGFTWSPEQLELDTIVFRPDLLLTHSMVYNSTSPSQVRVIAFRATEHNMLRVEPSTPVFTMHFEVKKFNGYAEIDFDPSFHIEAIDSTRIPFPITLTSGSITYQDEIVRTHFTPPAPVNADGRVCVDLLSGAIPPLLGFDMGFEWETDEFQLDSVILGANPLGLTAGELNYGVDFLQLQRDTSSRDTLPFLPYGTKLMELCYVPRDRNSVSDLGIGQAVNPSFQVFWADTLVPEARYVIRPGDLYLEGSIPKDTVALAVVPVPDALVDTLACVNLTAEHFTGVNSFDLSVSWPENLRLDSHTFTEGLFPDANTALLARTDTSARFGIQPEVLSNYNVGAGIPILELCFAGEFSDCDFYPIRVESQPETTTFLRKTADFTEGIPLPFTLSSGYLEPLASESLGLELEIVMADPSQITHQIKLHATNDLCVAEFPFLLSYNEDEVWLIGISQASERAGTHRVRQVGTPANGVKQLIIETSPGSQTDDFPAGEVATFTFRRRGDQDTVPILLSYDVIDSVLVRREDGKDFFFPASLTDGAFIFKDSTTAATWVNTGGVELTVYPNPASEILNVRGLPTSLAAEVWIYDNLGRQVLQRRMEDGSISLAGLSAGVYSLRLRQGILSWVERFVVR